MPLDLEKIDLGSFGINEDDDQQTQLNANMTEAVKVNPDQHAQLTNLSKESGVPEFAVQSNPEQIEQKLKLDKIDLDGMVQRSPGTSKFLSMDINNSVIAQEDVIDGLLENIETALISTADVGRALPAGFISGFGSAFEGTATTLDAGSRLTARGLDALLPESFDQYLYAQKDPSTTERMIQMLLPQTFLRWEGAGLKQAAADIGVPEDRQNIATDISGAVGQIGQQLLTYAINPTAATAGLFAQGVDQQAARQERTGTIGEDVESDLALLTGGAITLVSEKIGLDAILNRIPPKIKNDIIRQITDITIAGGIEAIQEVAENVAHGLLEQFTTNPDAEIFEGLDREAIAAGGAGAIVRGIVNALTPGRARSVQDDEIYKETIGEIEQNRIDVLNANSEKSKLRERDVESFKQFIREADGDNNTHVFIDGVQTALYLQGKTREEIEADPALKVLDNAVQESRATNTDVVIPVADFTGDIAGTEHFEQLRDHMTMSDETVSPFRQEQHREETRAYVDTLMAEAQENVSEYVEAQEIYTSVRDQLIDTGAVNAANASIMAQIVPAWATAQARRSGRSVAEVYASTGLVIEGPQTGKRARLEGEQVLTQEPVVVEQASAEILETGKPVTFKFTHNTDSATAIFGVPDKDAPFGRGFEPSGRYVSVVNSDAVEGQEGSLITGELTLRNPLVIHTEGTAWKKELSEKNEGKTGKGLSKAIIAQGHDGIMTVDDGSISEVVEFTTFDEAKALFQEPVAPVEQRDTIPTEVREDEQIERRPEEADQRRVKQETIDTAKARDDSEALAEFNRAKAGEEVTFVHRSFDDFTSFDDSLLGTNTTTPSGNLGHYLSADDIQNSDRYGNDVSVHQFTFNNPLVISAETFEDVMGDLNPEEVMERREALMELGHDGILIEDLNWAIAFEGSTLNKLEDDVELLLAQEPDTKGRVRGFYDPANSVIRLAEAADLSTFLHEFAHFMYEMEATGDTLINQTINSWYKRNAEGVAKEAFEGLPSDIKLLNLSIEESEDSDEIERLQKLIENIEIFLKNENIETEDVTAFLDKNTTGNKTKDSAIRRAVHEQFARGFETYLMEGKAPSIELRNAFRTFARWLAQIYQALRGDLKVNLDPEMRAVFDRLLATEEQIAAAESRARIEPMFTDAAMAGMTEKQFSDYQQRQEKVKDVQSETLREKLIKQLTRQTKAWWKEEKSDLVDEELDRLADEQIYSTVARLKDGDIKLDHATVKEMIGEERTDKLKRKSIRIPDTLRGMTAKGQKGVHPDEAAAFFGYNSGAEMLNELTNAPKIKETAEANAEARMLDRHGDIFTDGTIEQQADEAVQNEERGKLILHELKILSKGTNQRTLERQTVKSIAEERISQLSFREIHPGKYRKAEINAAQESARMLAEGNKEGAAQAKARQVLNYYLGMAATDAKNETTKIVDRMSRYTKKKVREEIQKAEGGYWDQIVKILERFEFKKSATLVSVDQVNQDINTWAKERMEIEGDGLVLYNAVLNESFVTHWKNVAFSDLQGINDSVKNIEHVARYANKLTRMGEEIEFNKLIDRWVTSMNETGAGRFKPKRTDVVEGRNWGRWFMAQMTKIPFMASWLDGGERVGISHQVMVQPFTDAYNEEIKLWGQAGKPVMEAIEGRSKADMKRHNRKIFIPEIDDNLYGHQIIAVALNTGNESNLRKLLLGEQWADPDNETEITFQNLKLQAVLSHMSESDWQLVQKIWDQMETLYPQLAEVHRRTTGLVPPKIESTPVQTPFGELRGGYYPVKYDPNRSVKAAQNEDRLNAETESMFSNNASIQSSVNTGATNERTGFYDAIRLSLDVVPAHFQETIHYITHHDPVREVNKLTRDARVAQTIKEKLGPEEYAQLRPWLNDIAKDGREAPTKMFWDDMLQRLRFGVTLGAMGFKASTGIIQISGLSNTIAEVGMANTLQAMRTILGSTTSMRSAWDFAVENSKVLEHRAQTMDREIKSAMKRIEGKRGIVAAVQEVSMKHIALIQTYMVDLPSWHAAYIKEMKESGDETKAFQHADFVVENVQGSGATKDLARIMRGQSETGRMFTMFMTFFSSLWNMERDLVKGAQSGRYSTTNVAAKAMFLFTIPVLFEMMMRGEFAKEDEDDETKLQKMLTGVAMYPVQSIPFVRDVANAVTGDFGYNISPLQSIIEQGTRTIPEIVTRGFTDDEITKGQAKGATKFIGAAAGIPGTGQAWASGEHLYDVMVEGEEFTLHQFLFGPERK